MARLKTREEYVEYLKSEHWQTMRGFALKRADWRCQVCNGRKMLCVHHRTYVRLGAEHLMDLTVLCSDCHELFHGVMAESPKPADEVERRLAWMEQDRQPQGIYRRQRRVGKREQRRLDELAKVAPGTLAREMAAMKDRNARRAKGERVELPPPDGTIVQPDPAVLAAREASRPPQHP